MAVVVRYTATEDSTGTHPLQLPDPITAYLYSCDLEQDTLLSFYHERRVR